MDASNVIINITKAKKDIMQGKCIGRSTWKKFIDKLNNNNIIIIAAPNI